MFAYCNNNPVVHLDSSGTRIVGFGFQGEIQGGDTAAGIEIIIYFDEEVCDGDDFIIVVYGYAGYELSPSQLKGILKCADAVVLAYSLESAYQESLNVDDDDAFCQYLFDASIVEALRGCLNGISLSGGLFVIDGKDGLFTCPEDYSGAFGAWNYTAGIGINSATLFVAESPSCSAVGIKTSKRIPGLLPGSATISPFSITYSRSYYSNPFVIYRGEFQ